MGNIISQICKKFDCFFIYSKKNNNEDLSEYLINKELKEYILTDTEIVAPYFSKKNLFFSV